MKGRLDQAVVEDLLPLLEDGLRGNYDFELLAVARDAQQDREALRLEVLHRSHGVVVEHLLLHLCAGEVEEPVHGVRFLLALLVDQVLVVERERDLLQLVRLLRLLVEDGGQEVLKVGQLLLVFFRLFPDLLLFFDHGVVVEERRELVFLCLHCSSSLAPFPDLLALSAPVSGLVVNLFPRRPFRN